MTKTGMSIEEACATLITQVNNWLRTLSLRINMIDRRLSLATCDDEQLRARQKKLQRLHTLLQGFLSHLQLLEDEPELAAQQLLQSLQQYHFQCHQIYPNSFVLAQMQNQLQRLKDEFVLTTKAQQQSVSKVRYAWERKANADEFEVYVRLYHREMQNLSKKKPPAWLKTLILSLQSCQTHGLAAYSHENQVLQSIKQVPEPRRVYYGYARLIIPKHFDVTEKYQQSLTEKSSRLIIADLPDTYLHHLLLVYQGMQFHIGLEHDKLVFIPRDLPSEG